MPPQDGEPLYLYVVATTQVVSAVIVVERTEEGHALPFQRPVYYISKVPPETKAHYPQIQKLLYAVVLARHKLRHYFEAHPVTVVSSFPLGEIIRNSDAEGRITKWSVELMGETLAYAPRKAIKCQILVDFVDGHTTAATANPGGVLDPLLRWVSDENTGGCGPALHHTPWGAHEVRGTPTLPRVKQHGGVRGPSLRPPNRHRDRHQTPRRQGGLAARD
jgi:hypothetical protein